MKYTVCARLNPQGEQRDRLLTLQQVFAAACNELAQVVQQTRTWNRVALHHLCYRRIRERYPQLGSQMACNAIYSVSRASRDVFQSAGSPFHIQVMGDRPLPLLSFSEASPVYFDRHTLSLRQGKVSMYTLDGRMKFDLALKPDDEEAFHQRKLLEIVLQRRADQFELCFQFGEEAEAVPVTPRQPQPQWPPHLNVKEMS